MDDPGAAYVRRIQEGMHIDDATIIAIEQEKVMRRFFSLARDDPAVTSSHAGLIDVFVNQGLLVARASRAPDSSTLFTVRHPQEGEQVTVSSIEVGLGEKPLRGWPLVIYLGRPG